MKHLNLSIGLFIAVLLAAGIYYAKMVREAEGEGPPPATPPDPSATSSAPPAVPDVTAVDGLFTVDGITVQVQVASRPIKAYAETTYRFRFAGEGGAALALDQGVVKFNMSMDMGRHHYALAPAGDDWYALTAPIPACPSGKLRWYGNMEFTIDGVAHVGGFQFDLTP